MFTQVTFNLVGFRRNKGVNDIFKAIALFLTGMIFSLSITAMILSENPSINPFYNVGEVSEIRETVYKTNVEQSNGYQEYTGRVILDQGSFSYDIEVQGNTNDWNYLCIWLKDVSKEPIRWEVTYINEEEAKDYEKTYSLNLEEGENLLPVEKNNFNLIHIDIIGENGTTFYITNIQLREAKPVFAWGKAISIFFSAFVSFFALTIILYIIIKKNKIRINLYCWVEILQSIYIAVAEQFLKLSFFVSRNIRKWGRTTLFELLFLYMAYTTAVGDIGGKFKYSLFIYILLLLLISILCLERKPEKKNWNNPLVWSWIMLWVIACVSDFLVPKEYRYIGYIMILFMGLLILAWNNMRKPTELIADFSRAVHIFFIIITIFCLIYRPETEGIRYTGFCGNPGIFSMYLGTCWAVTLGELESVVRRGARVRNIFFLILEGCLIISFCWKSQSTGPFLCMVGLAFIWLLKMLWYTKKERTRRNLIFVIISSVIFILPVYGGLTWGLKYIPQKSDGEINYTEEINDTKEDIGFVAHAAEKNNEEPRLIKKFSSPTLSSILSGRDYYYRTYLRDMNLFGHENNPVLWGGRRWPHNAVLGIAHRYGVFASVPYVLMLVIILIKTYYYGKRNKRYVSVPFFVCLSSIVMSLSDNVELPFAWLPWIGLYLMMGCVFET